MQSAVAREDVVERTPLPGAARWLLYVLVIFLVFVVARWEVIDSPPYYDFALGLFTEANYLVESDFDYYRLAHAEATPNDGGPRAYLISVLPTLLALLMKIAPSARSVLVVSHLASLACGSVLLVALFRMLAPFAGGAAAATAAAMLASTPLFSTQLDMLGIDLPMTTAAVLAMLLASRRRLVLASLAATAAFAMKPSGLITTVVLVAYDACLIVVLLKQAGWRERVVWSTCAATIWTCGLLVAQFLVFRWSNLGDRLQALAIGEGFASAVLALCPDQVFVFLVAVGATGVSSLVTVRRLFGRSDGGRPAGACLASQRGLLLIAAWLMVAATIAAIVGYVGVYSVRYLLLGLPFLYSILALTVFRWMDARALATLALCTVAFNLANWNGYFFPEVMEYRRHCSALERSHEYLADHRSNIEAMRGIEADYGDVPVVAGFPFPYFLSYPRLGYVSRPLRGYSINRFSGRSFPAVARLFDGLPMELLFVRVDNPNYSFGAIDIPPPSPTDVIVYQDRLASPLVVYRKDVRLALTESGGSEADWLLDHLWLAAAHDRADADQLVLRARWLDQAGYPSAAIEFLRRSAQADTQDSVARYQLALLLMKHGDWAGAALELEECCRRDPSQPDFHNALGVVFAQQGKLAEARQEFERVLQIQPNDAAARANLRRLAELRAGEPATSGAGVD